LEGKFLALLHLLGFRWVQEKFDENALFFVLRALSIYFERTLILRRVLSIIIPERFLTRRSSRLGFEEHIEDDYTKVCCFYQSSRYDVMGTVIVLSSCWGDCPIFGGKPHQLYGKSYGVTVLEFVLGLRWGKSCIYRSIDSLLYLYLLNLLTYLKMPKLKRSRAESTPSKSDTVETSTKVLTFTDHNDVVELAEMSRTESSPTKTDTVDTTTQDLNFIDVDDIVELAEMCEATGSDGLYMVYNSVYHTNFICTFSRRY
jgi:hypothetical protein